MAKYQKRGGNGGLRPGAGRPASDTPSEAAARCREYRKRLADGSVGTVGRPRDATPSDAALRMRKYRSKK